MQNHWRQLINDNEWKEYYRAFPDPDPETYLTKLEETMKATAMIPSKFLKKEDVDPAKLVTIKAIQQTNVAMDNEPEEMKYTLSFRELEKPMVLNSTNIQLIIKALGTDETDEWIGKQVVVYNDPNVSFAGKITGGVRIRAPKKDAAGKPAAKDFDDDIPF